MRECMRKGSDISLPSPFGDSREPRPMEGGRDTLKINNTYSLPSRTFGPWLLQYLIEQVKSVPSPNLVFELANLLARPNLRLRD